MAEEVATVTPSTPIHDAAKTMMERKIGALPVMDGQRLAGIISTTDVLRALLEVE
jgi:acetoin utilization protein AcuB